MGFQVTALACLAADTYHETFLVYVPTRRLQYEWINDWVYDQFSTLAQRLGPDSVLVAPPRGAQFEDFSEWYAHMAFRRDNQHDFLHAGFPFLAVGSLRDPGESPRAVTVNLAACRTPDQLGAIWDRILDAADRGGLLEEIGQLVPRTDLVREDDTTWGEWRFLFEHALELKPNFFGVGLNLNALAKWWRKRKQGAEP